MHHFEIGNDVETHRLTIVRANRNLLTLDLFGHLEQVTVDQYLTFGRMLTNAYHRLEGMAELVTTEGVPIVTLAFSRGRVDVRIVRGDSVRAFQTDQSYVMPVLAQIGILE